MDNQAALSTEGFHHGPDGTRSFSLRCQHMGDTITVMTEVSKSTRFKLRYLEQRWADWFVPCSNFDASAFKSHLIHVAEFDSWTSTFGTYPRLSRQRNSRQRLPRLPSDPVQSTLPLASHTLPKYGKAVLEIDTQSLAGACMSISSQRGDFYQRDDTPALITSSTGR